MTLHFVSQELSINQMLIKSTGDGERKKEQTGPLLISFLKMYYIYTCKYIYILPFCS